MICILHLTGYYILYARKLFRYYIEDKFVVYLHYHAGSEAFLLELAEYVDHRCFL